MIDFSIKPNVITLELKVKPANIALRILLLILNVACFLFIICIFFVSDGSPFGKLIGTVFIGAFVMFLSRLLLWNSFGKEIYEISTSEFTSINDYGWYKDKKKTIPLPQRFELHYIDTEYLQTILPLGENVTFQKKREYKIVFKVDGIFHQSVVNQKKKDMESFMKLLPEFGIIYPSHLNTEIIWL
ncbi:hypothetical protein [Flavobacterium psychrotrophum]|uniref:hypothetical protein n=1 Tax=Flavobacterium psychrotrophum TaxID=2294119 RepID=UPI000E316409|nr:hypothetical protein [Flavobacterium psychrotrophum]